MRHKSLQLHEKLTSSQLYFSRILAKYLVIVLAKYWQLNCPLYMTKVCFTKYRNCNFAKNNFLQMYYSRIYLYSRNTGKTSECLLLKKRAIFIFRSVKSDLSVRNIGWHNIAIDLGYTSFYLGVSR